MVRFSGHNLINKLYFLNVVQDGPVFLLKGVLLSKLMLFKQSLLYYPIVFSVGSLFLFLITSVLDEILHGQSNLNFPYLDSLIFTGSADASRSILSAIAGGWATILGVTFSVTLITLQLSSTKYTSHIVNRFEEDKLNQLTLAWFISVVLYSLLVLKTVRTGDGNDLGSVTFTPIIGVNVAVSLAIISLFIFVVFLNNISSYLRPNTLVSRILEQIIHSMKHFENRKIYDGQFDIHKEQSGKILLLEIRSQIKGICRSIDSEKICHTLQSFSRMHKKDILWMEWYKSLGDWIEKDELIATIYAYDKNGDIKNEKTLNPDDYDVNDYGNKCIKYNTKSNNDKSYEQRIVSYIDISKDRDISKDPTYGIELLRSLAVKSMHSSDTDVVNSCITGLFSVFRYVSKSKEFLGMPFTLQTNPDDKTPDDDVAPPTLIIMHPKEEKIGDCILSELSIILENESSKSQQITVTKHFVKEYISSSKSLLESDKVCEFKHMTKRCADQIVMPIESFRRQFQVEILIPIMDFKTYLHTSYPNLSNFFDINIISVLPGQNKSDTHTKENREI